MPVREGFRDLRSSAGLSGRCGGIRPRRLLSGRTPCPRSAMFRTQTRLLSLLPLLFFASATSAQSLALGELAAPDSLDGDQFGLAVDCAGHSVIVGTKVHDGGGGILSGAAYVYDWIGSWIQSAKLVASDAAPQDYFGIDVGLTADRAIAGASGDDDGGTKSGSAYVFERQQDGTWLEVAKLTASDAIAGADFGTSVDIDGDLAVVGAPDAGAGTNKPGHVYVYKRQQDGTWLEVAILVASDASNNDDFGWSVAIDGGRVIAGATLDDDAGGASGSAYIFEEQPDGSWLEVAKLVASDAAAGDQFGWSVDISGDTAVAGTWLKWVSPFFGAAYVYERQPDGSWSQVIQLLPPSGPDGGKFGYTVGVSGDVIAIGAHQRHVNSFVFSGEVFLYGRVGGAWNITMALDKDPEETDEQFGNAVAIDGDLLIVGAHQVDHTNGNDDRGIAIPYFGKGGGASTAYTQGTGTPGCNGPMLMGINMPPLIGATEFAFTCDNVPPTTMGLLGLSSMADVAGTFVPSLGILSHLDLSVKPIVFNAFPSDSSGHAEYNLPIPNLTGLVGTTWYAQSVWQWTTCSLPPSGYSSSDLITFTIDQF
ncbi:MAG TPA: hypothetical protein ENJ09_02865 [Planctomycetes bacterium]|nr:hypothetical protein [Planctomycetota bacterium]